MKKFLFIILITLTYLTSLAEVRFVSKTGSSTEPYTSWATAADSIQKCIDFSQSGDTIYIGAGTYVETLIVAEGIALIGSGIDSTIIDSRSIAYQYIRTIELVNNNIVKNLGVKSDNIDNGTAIILMLPNDNTIIENCLLEDAVRGINLSFVSATIKNCIISDCGVGIRISGYDEHDPLLENNLIYMGVGSREGIRQNGSGNPIINNNTIIISNPGADGTFTILRATEVKNNLMVSTVDAGRGFHFTIGNHPVENNVAIGNYNRNAMFFFRGNHIVRNNMVLNGTKGIYMDEQFTIDYKYNNVWNVDQPYIGFTPDNTNYSIDPMFVNADSMDFHLQMFSPMIDAGDPNILDKDGSRSDLGIYGGPLGESYTYQDLAPKPPRNLTLSLIDTNNVTLNWLPNTEADFYLYRVYRDTVSNFIYDTTKIIAVTSDTSFIELLPSTQNSYYYKITAIDNQYNQSPASEEAAVLVVDAEEPKLIANDYQFYPNYPNPFNPATTLSYRLKDNGTVRLVVYDIKGELIEELINEYQQAGYYEVDWNSENRKLASGIYLFRIEVKNENNIPVFSDMRKSILVK